MKVKLLLLGFIVLILYSINTHAQIPPFPDGYDTNNINTNYYNPYGDFNPSPTITYPTNVTLKWYLQFTPGPGESLLTLSPDGTLYVPANGGPNFGALYSIDTSTIDPNDGNYPLPDGFANWKFTTRLEWYPYKPTISADGNVYVDSLLLLTNNMLTELPASIPSGTYNSIAELNPTNGAIYWAIGNNGSEPFSPIAIGNDGTYYTTADTYVYALTNAPGVTNSFTNSFDVGPDHVFMLNNVGVKWAYKDTGQPGYFFALGRTELTVGLDNVLYVFDHYNSGNVYAFDGSSGAIKWRTSGLDTGGYGGVNAAIGLDGTIVVPEGHYLCAIDPNQTVTNGIMPYKWVFTNGYTSAEERFEFSPVIGNNGTIFAESLGISWGTYTNNLLFAINPDSGVPEWIRPLGSYRPYGADFKHGSVAVASDGEIYVADTDGSVYSFAPNGDTNWVYSTGEQALGSPLIGPDGTIYVESLDGGGDTCFVYALQGQSPIAYAGWPEDGRNARRTSGVASATAEDPLMTTNGFQFTMVGNTNFPVCAFGAWDLQTWTNLGQRILIGGMTNFVDIDSSNYPYRFYRAMPQ